MSSDKFDPMKEIVNLRNSVERVIEQGLNAVSGTVLRLQLDVIESHDAIIVHTSPIDGLDPQTLEISVERGILTISGNTKPDEQEGKTLYLLQERRFGAFERSVRIPIPVKANQARAKLKENKLTIVIPIDTDSYYNIKITPTN